MAFLLHRLRLPCLRATCSSAHPVKVSLRPSPQTAINRSVLPAVGHITLRTTQPSCRDFHTSPRRSALPPVAWVVIRAVAQIGSIIGGRTLRKRWQNLSDHEKKGVKTHLWKNKWFVGTVGSAFVLAVIIDLATHFQETPITHRKRYIAFTEEQLKQIVDFEFKMIMEDVKDNVVPATNAVYGLLVKVAQRIVDNNQDIDLLQRQKWTLIVVDSPEENAFVLPTGQIFVYTGIMKSVKTESQLAFMLSHELAHVILNHTAEKISTCQLIDKMIILLLAMLWFFIPTDGIAVITQAFFKKVVDLMLHLPYSRALETEADEVGLQLVAKACYDVRQSSVFWNVMALQSELPGQEGQIPEWLSTHPNHENRASRLDELIPEAIELRNKCKCLRLPDKDPRDEVAMLRQMAKAAVQPSAS
ncbi:hypothetical protein CAPTEDRAFT_112381 [Capitella teleta]|uniref:Metalloendopeptidase OMA1, mitochondrial n=1 Tax=Capitella teleta TaxID=283909 RepID=R7UR31_CAPTE|nr:hypothetical protein CAPTEDRAFT_112381 [Capitella teleta]|eukprot:ELU06397.1 hypothetical protein CAPTEDRAFT_112381 [Capitella teleta]